MRAALVLVLLAACNTRTGTVSATDSSCNLCHTNIGTAHTHAVVGCVDCHGGKELAPSEKEAFRAIDPAFKDSVYLPIMQKSHVAPRAGNEDKFLANGLTRGACFNGAVDPDCNGGDANGLGSV